VLAALALAAWQPGSDARQPAPRATLSVVGTNDLHGGVVSRDGRGGLALLGGYLRNLRKVRAADGGAVLLIDGGDMFQGTLESNLGEGAAVVAAYNQLGYAAATVGNHEFDFGPVGPAAIPAQAGEDPRGALKARAAEAKFPFLAANLIDEATGRPVEWPNVRPSVTLQAAGLTVGIIGVMTSEALSATIAANVRGLKVAPLAPTIAAEAARLRAAGTAVVIVTAHAGGRCTDLSKPADLSSCDPASEIVAVARGLPPGSIDAIVAGHTHAAMAHEVQGIAIIESYAGGRSFGRVDLVVDRESRTIVEKRIFQPRDLCAREDPKTGACDTGAIASAGSVEPQYEGVPVAPDAAIAKVLAPALERVSAVKARPLGVFLETPIRRTAGGQYPLGNLFTDALRTSVPGADVALHNVSGGLRADLPRGPLVYGSVYEVMPFDNKVVSLRLTGAQLRSVFAGTIQTSRRVFGISGIRLRAQCTGSTLDVTMLRPSGQPIKDDESLVLAVSDFLATGGDGLLAPVIPPGGFTFPDEAPLARDALAEHLQRHGGQIREDQFVDAANPRVVVTGAIPLKCGNP
jgi:5'-nucleotidase